jgi:Nucleotidyl transferase AbiEii toxin, Type IV TA system
MFNADVLTFQEFVMREQLPLSTIHNAVFGFLRGRDDVALFGAQAVNAYVTEPRMTQDIDILALHASEIAENLKSHLSAKFHIAVRVRQLKGGRDYRLYQIQKSGNRHLVDIRQIEQLPQTQQIADVQVLTPVELIASKIISYHRRRGKPKSGTDWRDLAMLLLTFPELKSETGPVYDALQVSNAEAELFDLWRELVATPFEMEDDEDW